MSVLTAAEYEVLKSAMSRLSSEAAQYRSKLYHENLHETDLGREDIAETDAELEMIAVILQKLRP